VAKKKKLQRSGGALLKQKAARRKARGGKKKKAPQVVYRDTTGKFTARSSRTRQGVQVIGRKGYAKPRRRGRAEVAEAIADLGKESERVYTAATLSGTMADRLLQAANTETGQPLAVAFSEGPQSGVVSVVAGDLSFSVFFNRLDLQEMLAQALSSYFERAHATRERVSAKARAGKGSHRAYDLHRSVKIVVRLS
jgi:hypothetical protein